MLTNPNDKQKEIIIGSMLGDGSLNKIFLNRNSSFREGHCIRQEEWLRWKQEKLNPFSKEIKYTKTDGIITKCGKMYKDKTKSHNSCYFYTVSHPYFTTQELLWYERNPDGSYKYKIENGRKKRIKVLPKEFEVTPLILAVWFIDDGHNAKNRVILSTQNFRKEEVEILIEKIKKLGIKNCSLYKRDNGYIININSSSYVSFIELVEKQLQDLPKELYYKIDLSNRNPNTKWQKNKIGIPFFKKNGEKYTGRITLNKKTHNIGTYNEAEAKIISKKIIILKNDGCDNLEEYLKVTKI